MPAPPWAHRYKASRNSNCASKWHRNTTCKPAPPWAHRYKASSCNCAAPPPASHLAVCKRVSQCHHATTYNQCHRAHRYAPPPPWAHHYEASSNLQLLLSNPERAQTNMHENSATIAGTRRLTPPTFAPNHSRFYCKSQHFARHLTSTCVWSISYLFDFTV